MLLTSLYARFTYRAGTENAVKLLGKLKPYIRSVVCAEVPSFEIDSRSHRCLIIASDSNVVFVGVLDVVKGERVESWRLDHYERDYDEGKISEVVLDLLSRFLEREEVAAVTDVYEEYVKDWDRVLRYLRVRYVMVEYTVDGEVVVIIDPVAGIYPPAGLLRVLMEHGRLDFRILRSM